MGPYRLVLPSKKRISVEAVRMQRSQVVVFDAGPRDRMVIANRYLRQDIIGLYGNEDIVRWHLVAQRPYGCSVAEGAKDVASMFAPCPWAFTGVASGA